MPGGDRGGAPGPSGHGRGCLLSLGWDPSLNAACNQHGVSLVSVCSRALLDSMRPVRGPHGRIVEVSSQRDLEEVLGALARHDLLGLPFARVLTSDEFAVVTGAAVAAALDIPGLDLVAASRLRSKVVQKQVVGAAGIPVADHVVIDDIGAATAPPAGWSHWPAVIKPSSGADTASTAVLNGPDDFREFVAWRREWQAGNRAAATWASMGGSEFLLEQFVEGVEWSVDGVVYQGELASCSVGYYLTAQLASEQAFTHALFDPRADAWAYELARPFAHAALSALGLNDGIFHLEAFCPASRSELIYGECAARRGGGGILPAIKRKLGTDLNAQRVLLAVGRGEECRPGDCHPGFVGGAWLPAQPGDVLLAYASPEQLLRLPGVAEVTVNAAPGRQLPPYRGRFEYRWVRVGYIVLAAASRPEFERCAAGALREWEQSLQTAPGPRQRMVSAAMRVELMPSPGDDRTRPRLLSVGHDERLQQAANALDVELVSLRPAYRPAPPQGELAVPVTDVNDPGRALVALERSGLGRDFRRVLSTAAASGPVPAATIGAALGCPAVALDAAVALESLIVQRDTVVAAGIAVVPHLELDVRQEGAGPPAWDVWPAIVSPVEVSASEPARRCADAGELAGAIATLRARREADDRAGARYVVDAQAHGALWSVEGFTGERGIVVGAVIRHLNGGSLVHQRRVLLEPASAGESYAMAVATAGRVLSALGLERTMFSVEFARGTDDRPLFRSCHDRLSPGFAHALIEAKHGIAVAELAIAEWTGGAAPRAGERAEGILGEVSLPLRAGWLLSCPGEADVLERPGVLQASKIPATGAPLGGRRGWPLGATRVVIEADDEAQLTRRMDDVAEWFASRLEVAPYFATNRELWERADRRAQVLA